MAAKTLESYNRSVIAEAKEGDLLEFNRGVYSHWAVYIGQYNYKKMNFWTTSFDLVYILQLFFFTSQEAIQFYVYPVILLNKIKS